MQTAPFDSFQALVADGPMPDDWHVNGLSSVQEMAVILESVVAVMSGLGYSAKDIFGARLVLEEAICNALKHGHRHDPTKVVQIRFGVCPDRFLMEVEDQGVGFDPAEVPDATAPENLERPCGRGLLLMRHYAAWVRYNAQGNCVTFCIFPSEVLPAEQADELPALESAAAR